MIISPANKPDLFVDVGSHTGASIRRFYQSSHFGDWVIVDPSAVKIYAFEPLFHGQLKKNIDAWGYKNVTIIAKAAGTRAGKIPIYRGLGGGSTMVAGKQTTEVDYKNPIKVEAVNFALWLYDKIPDHNRVFVHINIEGMEYAILPMLMETGIWFVIDHLSVEFHGKKFTEHNDVSSRIVTV